MRKGSIYIIKNKCNDKVYIGQTTQNVYERFKQHLKPSVSKKRGTYKIYNAINIHGKENFYVEVLEEDIPYEKLDEREIYYIEKYNSFKNGYNSTNGGDSKTISKIQDIELLISMDNEKKSYDYMAKVFNVNKITIQRTLHSLGRRRVEKISKDELLRLKDNYTNIQIAEMYNISPASVGRYFKRFGMPRGKGCSNHLNKQNQKQIK